jgi:antitoxin HigA-1
MSRIPTHRAPTHPGEMLRVEYLEPLGLTQTEVAERLGISFPRLNELINGKRGVTPDTALRLSRLFNTSPGFWLNLQTAWDLFHAMQAPGAAAIRKIRPLRQLAHAGALVGTEEEG